MSNGFDREILQDFLTESGELVQQLEGDLVVLEGSPRDPELLNQVFRALHTIKGSASFLNLTNLVRVAHAAESALNAARNSLIVVDRPLMNLLLETVDLLKTHLGQVESGAELTEPRAELVSQLVAAGEGRQSGGASSTKPVAAVATAPVPEVPVAKGVRKLDLGPGKADLLPFLVQDLDETMSRLQGAIDALATTSSVPDAATALVEQCEQLGRAVDFFEFQQMNDLAAELGKAAAKLPEVPQHAASAARAFRELFALLGRQAEGIRSGEVREVHADDVLHQVEEALSGRVQAEAGATSSAEAPVQTPAQPPTQPVAQAPGRDEGETATKKSGATESTIRVEVQRLETLMNLVGELVLQKNRIASLSRRIANDMNGPQDLVEGMSLAAGSLDRVTSDIQLAVMRTRMQPLDKLFGRYPRLIRDLAAKTGKQINLVIEGGETEVDKSVIEELGDPLVHLLRNSCDHGLELPEDRVKAGKHPTGTLTLRATHEGSHVRVLIIDDGRGLSRDRIGRKAIERAMIAPEQLAQLSDREVFKFIFEPGFSTAEKVSDLSGRGVGMDVVRTNISKLKGTVDLSSEAGRGTTVAITIPLTVAILQAMMVGVGPEVYAVPLTSIIEIVRPESTQVSTIGGRRVMRLRDSVLPLVDGAEVFEQPTERQAPSPFAVVLQMNDQRMGLMVSRLIGQQEVVIKPLDELGERSRQAVSGATVRDDGGVSLIVDVAELIRLGGREPAQAA